MNTSSLLSARENEVAKLLLLGKSNKQIAITLNITIHTVEFHISNIYRKIGVVSRSEAILALTKIELGKAIGEEGEGELGETIVEIGPRAGDNAKYPIFQRVPMKRLIFFCFVLLVPTLYVVLVLGENAVGFRPGDHSSKVISQETMEPATRNSSATSSVVTTTQELIGLATSLPYETSYPSTDDPSVRVSTGKIAHDELETVTANPYEAGYASPNDLEKRASLDKNSIINDTNNQPVLKSAVGISGWIQRNIDGFGDLNNLTAGLLAHNGMLYAGTQNNTSGGQIWRTADGQNWSAIKLYGGAYYGGENTFIVPINVVNDYLYVGIQNNNSGGQIWRCALCDGSDWNRVLDGSELGPSYFNVQTVIGHSDAIYATVTGWDGLAVLRSTNGDAGTWTQVNTSGFGKTSNVYTWSVVNYNGFYYVATNTPDSWNFDPPKTSGVEVWRCATCTGSDWQQVNLSGFGDGRNGSYSMVEFSDKLYLSVVNLLTGVQIRRCAVCDGSDWEQVNTNGFGQANRYGAILVPYEGKLFAFTSDLWTAPDQGVELFITKDGTHWDPVMIHGWGDSNNWVVNGNQVFDGSLYVGVFNQTTGGEIWQYLHKQVFIPSIFR